MAMVLQTRRHYTFREQGVTRITHRNLKQKQTGRNVDCSLILEEKVTQSSSVQALAI